MPNKPKTPQRVIRVDDELWVAFGQATKRHDPPMDRSAAVRWFMRWFVGEVDNLPERPERPE